MQFYYGIIEDRDDPEKNNRVRVRVQGLHGPEIKTEDLPWGLVMMPTTSSGKTNRYSAPHGLEVGSWVIMFFTDEDRQDPMIMGSILSWTDGYIADTNTRAREEQGTVNPSATFAQAKSNGSWSLPADPYKATYPLNKVHETESGHVIEIDDTVTGERIKVKHTSGSYIEMHPNGDVVTHVVGNNYLVVEGECDIGVKGDANLTIEKNADVKVQGEASVVVNKNASVFVEKNLAVFGGESVAIASHGNVSVSSQAETSVYGKTVQVRSAGGINLAANGGVGVTEGGLNVVGSVTVGTGATGTFSTPSGRTITVSKGIVTGIV